MKSYQPTVFHSLMTSVLVSMENFHKHPRSQKRKEKIDESSEDQSSLYGEDIDISDRNKDDAFYYRQIEDDIDNKGMSQNDDNNHDDSENF